MLPLHLHIPKYVPVYSSELLSRPKLTASTYFGDGPRIASTRESSVPVEADALPPLSASIQYHYANGGFDSPISPSEMYETSSPSGSCPPYQTTAQRGQYVTFASTSDARPSHETASYLSDSPSPVGLHASASFLHAAGTVSPQARHAVMLSSCRRHHPQVDGDSATMSDHCSTGIPVIDKAARGAAISQNGFLDYRRMSEPAILRSSNPYASQSFETPSSDRPQASHLDHTSDMDGPRISGSAYIPSLQRGTSISSLRDLRQSQFTHSPPSPHQYSGSQQLGNYGEEDGLDGPISPLQPSFGFEIDSPTAALRFLPSNENYYGSSPPGTGTSTSSAPLMSPTTPSSLIPSSATLAIRDSRGKTYSFVPLPGNNMRKRPRRRYDEIERLYRCSWPDCIKAYGTLNHLNAHVTMQKHGPKRNPNEFKELRKQWRKAKKDTEMSSLEAMQRGSITIDKQGQHKPRRYNMNDHSSSSLYAEQLTASASSSIPILTSSSGERYPGPDAIGGSTGDEHAHHRSILATAARHRHGATPASWHGSSQSRLHGHLSSSLPSQSIARENNISLPHMHTVMPTYPSLSYHHSQAAPIAINQLPVDSTLFTPLPGHHPPILSAQYETEVYEAYERNLGGRPSTGHSSTDQGSGDER